MENRKILVIGGGTFSHVRTHLALCAPAFGETAREIAFLAAEKFPEMDVQLCLTKMALGQLDTLITVPNNLTLLNQRFEDKSFRKITENVLEVVTNEDVSQLIDDYKRDFSTKIVFFNPALVDYDGSISELDSCSYLPSGKYATRLKTSEGDRFMKLRPAKKILKKIREGRKDILLVAFKTTSGATENEQYITGLELLKKNSCNLVLANDVVTRVNMIITPEEARYHVTTDRKEALKQLVDMAWHRSHNLLDFSALHYPNPGHFRCFINYSSNRLFSHGRAEIETFMNNTSWKHVLSINSVKAETLMWMSTRYNYAKEAHADFSIRFRNLSRMNNIELSAISGYVVHLNTLQIWPCTTLSQIHKDRSVPFVSAFLNTENLSDKSHLEISILQEIFPKKFHSIRGKLAGTKFGF